MRFVPAHTFHSFATLFPAKAQGIMADNIWLGLVRLMAMALQGSQAATQVARGSTPNLRTATERLAGLQSHEEPSPTQPEPNPRAGFARAGFSWVTMRTQVAALHTLARRSCLPLPAQGSRSSLDRLPARLLPRGITPHVPRLPPKFILQFLPARRHRAA